MVTDSYHILGTSPLHMSKSVELAVSLRDSIVAILTTRYTTGIK